MTRDELYDILRYISHATDSLELIWGQPFDGETEKINTAKSASSTSPTTEESSAVASSEKQQIAIGRDCCGKEIIPILGKKLEVRTNRHTTTDGYLWGWIEGTTANTVWGDDHKFNHAAAVTLVRDYNAESSAKHEANTTKSVSPTPSTTEESSVVDNSGNETDFVTKSMTADEIMAGKMAKDRVESDRWYAMFSEPFPTEEDAQ